MYSSKDGNWFAIILRTGRLPSQMTWDDPGKNRVKRQQELPDAFVCSWCSPEGSGSPPHDPENPWELPKGPCCQAPPNMTPHRWEVQGRDLQRGERERPLRDSNIDWTRHIPMQARIFWFTLAQYEVFSCFVFCCLLCFSFAWLGFFHLCGLVQWMSHCP